MVHLVFVYNDRSSLLIHSNSQSTLQICPEICANKKVANLRKFPADYGCGANLPGELGPEPNTRSRHGGHSTVKSGRHLVCQVIRMLSASKVSSFQVVPVTHDRIN